MDKEYRLSREYSLMEIVRYNLRMWWLAVIFALVCAALLGGYKYRANRPFVEKTGDGSFQQVTAALYVNSYSDESAVERVNTIIKLANSNRVYEKMIENTGYDLDFQGYQELFDTLLGEVSDVVSIYVNYPAGYGNFSISDEAAAKEFAGEIIKALDEVSQEMIGQQAIRILDAPYAASTIQELESDTITKAEFWRGVLKAGIEGVLAGMIAEVLCYTFWLLLYKKPKNAEEIRQCIGAPVIDALKEDADNEETFKKIALFLKGNAGDAKETPCRRISCMTVQCPKKDVASKLAMSYANEQKKTLFINLAVGENGDGEGNSISQYILGEAKMPKPVILNPYLDVVCRNEEEEKGFNLVMSKGFENYLDQMSREYEYIVIGSLDAVKSADAYGVSKLCDKTLLVCGRKTIKNETLYRVKNTADVNQIRIDGILVYEL